MSKKYKSTDNCENSGEKNRENIVFILDSLSIAIIKHMFYNWDMFDEETQTAYDKDAGIKGGM